LKKKYFLFSGGQWNRTYMNVAPPKAPFPPTLLCFVNGGANSTTRFKIHKRFFENFFRLFCHPNRTTPCQTSILQSDISPEKRENNLNFFPATQKTTAR